MSKLLIVLGMSGLIVLYGHWRFARRSRILRQTALGLGLTYRDLLLGKAPADGETAAAGPRKRRRRSRPGAGLLRMLPNMWTWDMQGSLDGVAVNVTSARYGVTIRAGFRASLELGLRIDPQVSLDGVATALGQQDIATGNDAFDRQFVIQGRRPEIIAAVCRDATLQRLLPGAFAAGYRGWVDDTGVVILFGERTPSAATLRPLLASAAQTARAIEGACGRETGGR